MQPRIRAAVLAVALLGPVPVVAQPAAEPRPAARQSDADAFADMLRRTDPDAHARYVRLREAREASLEALMRAQDRYRSSGPELRSLALPSLRAARRQYGLDALALLDFLEERDRRALEQHRAAIEQINGILAERARARAELQDLVKE
jgi:hypothetical protein